MLNKGYAQYSPAIDSLRTQSNDYNKYFLKDGIFVGKFEEMYVNCENPWHQLDDEHVNSLSKISAIEIMKRLKITSLVEFGCGLGAFTNKIYNEMGIKITGVDCSKTAIEYAKNNFSTNNEKVDFIVDDIKSIVKYKGYDGFLFADIMWYILEDLDAVLMDMKKSLKGKYLVNVMSFYRGQQKYGVEKFTNPEEFLRYMPFENIANVIIDFADNKDAYASVTTFII